MNNKRKLVTIGISAAAALAILVFGINYLKGINLFHTSNYYYAIYDNVTGLAVSAPVTANGFKVGQVREMNYLYDDPGHVRVELALDGNLKVPEGTVAVLGSDLLGTATISLEMPQSAKYAKVGSHLESRQNSGLMENVSGDLMPGIVNMIPKIDSLLVAVTTLVSDPALSQSVKRLDAITADLADMSSNLSNATKPLPQVMGNVTVVAENLNRMSSNLDSLCNEIKSLPLDETMSNVLALSENLKQTTDRLQSSESSLGLLLNDPGLYNSLNHTVASLDSLINDVKAQPKRYLKFSVF